MPDEKTNSNHELIENYDDVTWLYDWWPMVKSNFKNLLNWVTAHINGTGNRHSAADINYNSGTVEDGLITLSNAIETGLSELADADAENCKYTIHQGYDVDISKVGSGNNVLYITIDGVNNYSQMSGKAVAINTGIYQCTFSSPSTVYVNVNGLGNKALRRPLPYDYADYDTKQYYTDKYCYGEIGRHQTLIVYYDGSNFILTNVAVPTKATKEIELGSTDDSSYTTPKAVGVIAGKVKDDIGDLSNLNTKDKTSVVNAINEKAPTSHASGGTTYGAGSSSNYGHVKLSDSTNSMSGESSGIAATPAAVKTAYDLALTTSSQIRDLTSTILEFDLDINDNMLDIGYTQLTENYKESYISVNLSGEIYVKNMDERVTIEVDCSDERSYPFSKDNNTLPFSIFIRLDINTLQILNSNLIEYTQPTGFDSDGIRKVDEHTYDILIAYGTTWWIETAPDKYGVNSDYTLNTELNSKEIELTEGYLANFISSDDIGDDTNYGIVKLSDSTSSTSGTSDGTAATPAAVKAVYDAIPKTFFQIATIGGADASRTITLTIDNFPTNPPSGTTVIINGGLSFEASGTITLNINEHAYAVQKSYLGKFLADTFFAMYPTFTYVGDLFVLSGFIPSITYSGDNFYGLYGPSSV